MHCAPCTVLHALCFMHCASCTALYALRSMHCDSWTVLHALRSMRCAPRTVLHALCSLHYASHTVIRALYTLHCAPGVVPRGDVLHALPLLIQYALFAWQFDCLARPYVPVSLPCSTAPLTFQREAPCSTAFQHETPCPTAHLTFQHEAPSVLCPLLRVLACALCRVLHPSHSVVMVGDQRLIIVVTHSR
jgi:hypothetical protein